MSVIGIDLGNNSLKLCVARRGGFDILANEASKLETPTVVSFGDKERCIGESGATARMRNLQNTITDVKQYLGRRFAEADVQADVKEQPFSIVDSGDGGIAFEIRNGGEKQKFLPEQIVAMLLTQVNKISLAETGSKVGECVISVPGYYTVAERVALHDACRIANINCLRLLNENTAAAMQWGIYRNADLPDANSPPIKVLIVDIGQASFSCSVVEFQKAKLRVIATAADRTLGGREFDQILLKHFRDQFLEKYKIDIFTNSRAKQRILAACEKMRIMLSANAEAPISVECLMNDIDVKGLMKREELEVLVKPILERVAEPIIKVMKAAQVEPSQFFSVELVGGCSRMPALKEIIRKAVGQELSYTLNASEAVCKGCAIVAASLSPKFRVREFECPDCVPYTIEIAQQGLEEEKIGEPFVLFKQFAAIPATKMITFQRKNGFELRAQYSANNEGMSVGSQKQIARFIISSIPAVTPVMEREGSKNVPIKVRMKIDNIGKLVLESACALLKHEEEEEIVEPAPAKEEGDKAATPAAAAAAAAAPASPAAESGSTGAVDAMDTSAPSEGGATPKKTRLVVKTSKKYLEVVQHFNYGVSDAVIQKCAEQEIQMDTQDRVFIETADKKNECESYVLDMRTKISEGGSLHQYTVNQVREDFLKLLEEVEGWLYGEGEDTQKSAYVKKLEEVHAIGDPISNRYKEEEARAAIIPRLRERIQFWTNEVDSTDEKYSHIEQPDRDTVKGTVQSINQWLEDSLAKIQAQPKHENPPVTAREFNAKLAELDKSAGAIMNKPKPKPKPAPAPATTPAADATTNKDKPADATASPKNEDSPDAQPSKQTPDVDMKDAD